MVITVTSLRLKSWWRIFELSLNVSKISQQLRNQKGFIKLKTTGFGHMHFTMSVWEGEEDVKRFYREGAHLEAMKRASKFATETRTFTYQSEKLPSWREAKKLLVEKGKMLKWS